MSTIKVIHFKEGGGKASECLEILEIPKPQPEDNDLLVNIEACAVNPVDTKIREGEFPATDVTGYDGAGVVEAVGKNVTSFKPGDEVYYSGVLNRRGTTAQYNLIDHRLAAIKPNLDWVTAASIPLVSITAWELLHDHFDVKANKSILIINGAGGVGSIATQLASKVFKLNVIVTASRQETIDHAKNMGATHTINHHKPLKDQLKSLGIENVDYVMICHSTNGYLEQAVDIVAPFGKIGSIVEVTDQLPGLHKPEAFQKSLSFHWEFMLGKGMYNTDLQSQGDILKKVAELYNNGVLTSLVSEQYTLSVANLIKAHEKLESGKSIGKISLKVEGDIN